jgi:hypothetical protein
VGSHEDKEKVVNPVDNELWREIGAMDATMRKRFIVNGEPIEMVVESHPKLPNPSYKAHKIHK